MTKQHLLAALEAIHATMAEHRAYLIELDARNGDGDLGISMDQGFAAAARAAAQGETDDLGRLLLGASKAFNEAAPSSLGTILSLGLMGMAKALKGQTECTLAQCAQALTAGVEAICAKTGSKAGEKTVLDAFIPAAGALLDAAQAGQSASEALAAAAQAAAAGCEATRDMLPVHGRAAYYGEKLLGVTDGGAEAGRLLFAALAQAFAT